MENKYKDVPGQWQGIHFYRGSVNNSISPAIIKNAGVGIRVDSLPENDDHGLRIKYTEIKNMSAYGVLGLTAHIIMENTVISNCQINSFIGYYGGEYLINHCTFYSGGGRRDPHFLFNNQQRDDNKVVIRTFELGFEVLNSIVWGPNETEFWLDLNPDVNLITSSVLSHSLIKAKSPLGGTNNLYNQNPQFEDISRSDFKLKA